MLVGERDAIISGIGQSAVGRRLERSGLDLTLEAAVQALQDSGLEKSDIDGIATWPGYRIDMPAFSPVTIGQVKDSLGIDLNWYSGGSEATQLSAIINACMAVATGQARHVLCYRTMTESSAMAKGVRSSNGAAASVFPGLVNFRRPLELPHRLTG